MFMFFHGQRILRDLQDEFQAVYPYLRIEFLWKQNASDKPHSISADQESLLQIADIAALQHQEMVILEDETTLKEIEQKLKKDFGVSIRFFHFTDSGWIAAGKINTATFGELNQQGRESFHRKHNVSANPEHLL